MKVLLFTLSFLMSAVVFGQQVINQNDVTKLYSDAVRTPSKLIFNYNCSKKWKEHWFLDGEKAKIENKRQGMYFYAGGYNEPISLKPVNEYHATLWTRRTFEGDIRIEYDYTKLDTVNLFVSIIYIFATGQGVLPYDTDISKWSDLRKISAMNEYFDHMNTYHISYSAKVRKEDKYEDYIRARRYMPGVKRLGGTELFPEYVNSGFFEQNVKHHITIISRGDYLFMKITAPGKSKILYFDKKTAPLLNSGRIGLRMMNFRAALFDNFKVYSLDKK